MKKSNLIKLALAYYSTFVIISLAHFVAPKLEQYEVGTIAVKDSIDQRINKKLAIKED